jgi:hypothetical protein
MVLALDSANALVNYLDVCRANYRSSDEQAISRSNNSFNPSANSSNVIVKSDAIRRFPARLIRALLAGELWE